MPGSKKTFLGEVKTVNGQVSNLYIKASDRRRQTVADRCKTIDRDIVKRMRDLDRDFNGTQDGGGPCETHLRSKFGKMREFAFGAFGEWSVRRRHTHLALYQTDRETRMDVLGF